jgi:membrane-bound lytic murein transglycosylase B
VTAALLVGTMTSVLAVAGTGPPAAAAEPGTARNQAAAPAADTLAEWAEETSDAVGVPERALLAYAAADLALREEEPGCGLSWSTLAGIGRVESNHGRFGGARLDDEATARPEIVGLPLDGSPGIALIVDTDGGELDGDTELDRAVGPMQFIPGTWAQWRSDGDGDDVRDPHDLDDAALAAGRYLCAGDRDLTTGDGWWAALYAYNRSVEYGQRVYEITNAISERADS